MPQVLIIDDEPEIRKLLRLFLERKGYCVETAADGLEGIQKFSQDPAELVISDIIMPEMDGLKVIQTLKRVSPEVNLISISGGGRISAVDYLELASKLGVRYTFEKPIDRKALLAAVAELLPSAKQAAYPASIARSTKAEIETEAAALDNLLPLVEILPHFFWVLDRNRQVVLANRVSIDRLGLDNVGALYGRRPGEVLNCQNAALSPHGCGTAPGCATCGALKAITSAQEGTPDIQECRICQRAEGNALDLRVWTHPLALAVEGCIGFQVHDISNEKRDEALERTFFHDLLNIAGGLKSGLSMLNDLTPEEQAEVLSMLITASQGLVDKIKAWMTAPES